MSYSAFFSLKLFYIVLLIFFSFRPCLYFIASVMHTQKIMSYSPQQLLIFVCKCVSVCLECVHMEYKCKGQRRMPHVLLFSTLFLRQGHSLTMELEPCWWPESPSDSCPPTRSAEVRGALESQGVTFQYSLGV